MTNKQTHYDDDLINIISDLSFDDDLPPYSITNPITSSSAGSIASSGIIGAVGASYTHGPQGISNGYGGASTPPYTTSVYGAVGGGGGSSGSYTISHSPSIYTLSDNDYSGELVIRTRDGNELNVVSILTSIMEQLGIIQPNKHLIEKYPALKEAYDEYVRESKKIFLDSHPELKAAIQTYETIESIVKLDESSEED